MSTLSDQAAADGAERSGDRFRTAPVQRLYVMDVHAYYSGDRALYRWVKPFPEVWFEGLPYCSACAGFVKFTAPPTHLPEGAGWRYHVKCGCGEDEVLSPFPLAVGGPVSWWKERGWNWSGWPAAAESDSEGEAPATIGTEVPDEDQEEPHEARRQERDGEES